MYTKLIFARAAVVCGLLAISHHALSENWTLSGAPPGAWHSVACSADGTKLVAVSGRGPVYTSADGGVTWTSNNVPALNWQSVASSADGRILAAADCGGGYGGWIYASTNAGETWGLTGAPFARWTSIAASADGQTLLAATMGKVYRSIDAGTAWSETSTLTI